MRMRAAFPLVMIALLALAGRAAGAPVRLPTGKLEHVDFERHVVSLLGKHGCSSGACHGSFQGRGGLRLSLLGFDPSADYEALARAARGRRVSRVAPERSLVVLQPGMALPHRGGKRLDTAYGE